MRVSGSGVVGWVSRLAVSIVAVATLVGSPVWASGEPETFQESKQLVKRLWAEHRVDFYCGCRFDARMNVSGACGMPVPLTRKGEPNQRARRIEWEHVVPAADFGRQRPCWREVGARRPKESAREFCERTDPAFARMHADPRNLVPAIGLLNQYRSDLRYAEIPGEEREYGTCDFERSATGGGERSIEPPAGVKGDVARIYFYYEARHGHRIGRQQRQLFEAWSRMDPPDDWELERDRELERVTGVVNPVLKGYRERASK